MKKILSLLLSAVLLLSFFTTAFAAENEDHEYTPYPVIVVPGYSSSSFYRIDENEEQVHVWGIDMEEITRKILENIVELGVGLKELTKGNAKKVADTVGREFYNMYYDLACNDDGSSVYDLKRYCVTAEESCSAVLDTIYPDKKFQHEAEIMGEYANYIGTENIFNFNCDFRMSAVYCAEQLDEFIQSVKQYTGKDKVNIFAVSHGGQVAGTYLTLFGEKGDVNNAVLTVPALGGAGLAYDIMADKVNFDELGLLRFIEHGMMLETDLNWLVRAEKLGFLDQVIKYLIPHILKVLGNWGSIWDFIPTEYYEDVKAFRLDAQKNAELIKKSDYMHYEVMPKFSEGFKKAQKSGTDVFIIAGYNNKIVTGLEETSDAIITLKSSTGATVAEWGKRFSDGYVQKVNTGFYQVSPSMTVDASTSYLPEHTFFVENLYHGMTYKDPFTAELLKLLLLTEEIKDVHTDPNFPQFHATTNKSHSVFAKFNSSVEGYVSSADNKLVVTNLSEKYPMKITSIDVRGADLCFNALKSKLIKPGKSIELSFNGKVAEVSYVNIDVVIDYTLIGSATPAGERTLNFTVLNGEPVKYDAEKPYTVSDLSGTLDTLINDKASTLMKETGTKELFEIICNFIISFKNMFSIFVGSIFGNTAQI